VLYSALTSAHLSRLWLADTTAWPCAWELSSFPPSHSGRWFAYLYRVTNLG